MPDNKRGQVWPMQKTHSDIGFRCIKPSDVSEVKDAKALHKTSLSDVNKRHNYDDNQDVGGKDR